MEKLMKTSKTVDKVLKFIYRFLIIVGAISTVLSVMCLILMTVNSDVMTTTGVNNISFSGVTFELKEIIPADKTYMMVTLLVALMIIVIVFTVSCFIIRSLRNVLNPMKEGQPFVGTVSKDLKKLGFAVMIGGVISDIVMAAGNHIMFISQDVMEVLKSDMVSNIVIKNGIDLTTVFAGILIIMLSHVFRYGEELQQQANETL